MCLPFQIRNGVIIALQKYAHISIVIYSRKQLLSNFKVIYCNKITGDHINIH